jgi:hypothetical protein
VSVSAVLACAPSAPLPPPPADAHKRALGQHAEASDAVEQVASGRTARGWSHLVSGCAARLPRQHDFSQHIDQLLAARGDAPSISVTVNVNNVQLTLLRAVAGHDHPKPLAALHMHGLWIVYTASEQGVACLKVWPAVCATALPHRALYPGANPCCPAPQLALPTLTIHDLRPNTPKQRSVVLGTSAGTRVAESEVGCAAFLCSSSSSEQWPILMVCAGL